MRLMTMLRTDNAEQVVAYHNGECVVNLCGHQQHWYRGQEVQLYCSVPQSPRIDR